MESATRRQVKDAAENPRRHAILDAAKLVFFEEGYAGAAMDQIAARAGVTKRTVYGHFAGKDALFAAVVERACANVVRQLPTVQSLPEHPAAGLAIMLERSRELMRSENCIRLERIIAAEAERRPQFAATLRAAFDTGEEIIAQALAGWIAAGRLRPLDVRLVARILNDQAACAVSFRGLLREPIESETDHAMIGEIVRAFMAVYGA